MKCRDCGRRIEFVRLPTTGRAIPVDPLPDHAGNVAATISPRGGLVGRVLTKDRPRPAGEERLYMPHKASCPAIRRASKPKPTKPDPLF